MLLAVRSTSYLQLKPIFTHIRLPKVMINVNRKWSLESLQENFFRELVVTEGNDCLSVPLDLRYLMHFREICMDLLARDRIPCVTFLIEDRRTLVRWG